MTLPKEYISLRDLRTALPAVLPSFLEDASILEAIGVGGYEIEDRVGLRRYVFDIGIDCETSIPLLPGGVASIVLGEDEQFIQLTIVVEDSEQVRLTLEDIPLRLRLATGLLHRAHRENGQFVVQRDSGGKPLPLEASTQLTASADREGRVRLEGNSVSVSISPFAIGETGLAVECTSVILEPPADRSSATGTTIRFNEAKLYLPEAMADWVGGLNMSDVSLGPGGFSGSVERSWQSNNAPSGTLFGMQVSLERVNVGIVQNTLAAASASARLTVPFFKEAVDADLGIGLNGDVYVAVGDDQGALALEEDGLLKFNVESIGFDVEDGVGSISLTGELRPLVGNLDWPAFQVEELRIDADGNVQVDGGWIDLPDQYSLDFYGFNFEITKLGFGRTEDGDNWIGFNGGIKFVDELSAGASVEGLRIIWSPEDPTDPQISFNGIGVEFEVPDAIRFAGEVAFRKLETPEGSVQRFDGEITLALPTLEMEIDGILVIGRAPGYTFLAIYLDLSLVAGIPIFNTGVALYGLAGLFALNMEPGKAPEEPWYGLEPGEGWYRRPEVGVTDLKQKWTNRRGSLALGAGLTLGTVSDNGFSFSSKLLLALVLPGPIVLLEGKANILKERAKLDEEPMFRSIIVFDGRAGTLTAGLNAQYRFDAEKGRLVDIQADAKALFSFSDPNAWHVYLGQREPPEKRIRAELYSIVEGTAYLMLDPVQLGLGGSIGIDEEYRFGPLKAGLEAWIEGHALLSFKPAHFKGEIWLHGGVEVSIFDFGFGLEADARIGAEVFDPFHLVGDFRITVDLPKPLKDRSARLKVEWGPRPGEPPIPLPLEEVSIEHLKSSTTWALPRAVTTIDGVDRHFLKPNFSRNGFYEPVGADPGAFPDQAPVVPLDARPRLTFGRSVHDRSGAAGNAQDVTPEYEHIGDPSQGEGPLKVKYSLQAIELQALTDADNGETWDTVAGSYSDVESEKKLYGSWAPVPRIPGGRAARGTRGPTANTKLWLWSHNGFDFARRTNGAWNERFAATHPGYPCVFRRHCYDFESVASGAVEPELVGATGDDVIERVTHPDEPELRFAWTRELDDPFESVSVQQRDGRRALYLRFATNERGQPDTAVQHKIHLAVPSPARSVSLSLASAKEIALVGFDDQGRRHEVDERPWGDLSLTLETGEWPGFEVEAGGDLAIFEICHSDRAPETVTDGDLELLQGLREETELWTGEGYVLKPDTRYRLRIVTGFEALGEGKLKGVEVRPEGTVQLDDGRELKNVVVEYAFFETEGPPGLSGLSVPVESPNPVQLARRNGSNKLIVRDPDGSRRHVSEAEIQAQIGDGRLLLDSDLDTLSKYVSRTLPRSKTGGQNGTKPLLTRPVYRAYDVGIEFNEDYVDLLYRSDRRDLAIYLYNRNDDPVRDPAGRLLTMPNTWGHTADLTLDAWEAHWITTVNAGGCAQITPSNIPRDRLLQARLGHVLDPDTVYEARLVPLLLHDDFSSIEDVAAATAWRVVDEADSPDQGHWVGGERPTIQGDGATVTADVVDLGEDIDLSDFTPPLSVLVLHDPDTGFPARYRIREVVSSREIFLGDIPPQHSEPLKWKIPGGSRIEQLGFVGSGNPRGRARGTLLVASLTDRPHAEQPPEWTNYRFNVRIRPMGNVVQGVVARFTDNGPYLRFTCARRVITHPDGFRQLAWIDGDTHEVLAEDHFLPEPDREYLISIEVVEDQVRVYQDGILIFEATDPTPEAQRVGAPGLYSFETMSRFADVRIDDLRPGQPVVYRYSFGTSLYATFFHHLHSYQDEVWNTVLEPPQSLTAALSRSLPLAETAKSPSVEENRTYNDVVSSLGLDPHRQPDELQVEQLLKPEPTGTASTEGLLIRSPEPIDWSRITADLFRSSDREVPSTVPDNVKLTDAAFESDESVSLLARESTDLSGHSVDYRDRSKPLVTVERFGENALKRYELVDLSDGEESSGWRSTESGLFYEGSHHETVALVTRAELPSLIRIRMAATEQGTIGVVWGYDGPDDHFRFEWNGATGERFLRKVTNGSLTTLWSDSEDLELGREYAVAVLVDGNRIRATLEGQLLFDLQTVVPSDMRLGFYCGGSPDALFSGLTVLERRFRAELFTTDFTGGVDDKAPWEFVDQPPYTIRESKWRIVGDELHQLSNIYGFVGGPYYEPGTYGVAGSTDWTDYRLYVRLRSDDNDAIGTLFRYQDDDNFYRFSMDRERNYRRLIKHVNGQTRLLWADEVRYQRRRWYDLTIECVGELLVGFLDDELLFAVEDADLVNGGVGLYCRANRAARFDRVEVAAAASAWVPYHTFGLESVLPAGTRIRIHTIMPDRPNQEPDLVHREASVDFSAPEFEPSGVDLRVRSSGNDMSHRRSFIPAGSYDPVTAVRILRRSDGTGALLMRDAGPSDGIAPLDPGAYRLNMEYRRDNTDRDPKSTVLTQAGSSAPEGVNLDFTVAE